MRRVFAAVMVLGMMSGDALAQRKDDEPLMILEREKKQQADAVDRQYHRTLEQTRKNKEETATSNDPWANMRAPNDRKK